MGQHAHLLDVSASSSAHLDADSNPSPLLIPTPDESRIVHRVARAEPKRDRLYYNPVYPLALATSCPHMTAGEYTATVEAANEEQRRLAKDIRLPALLHLLASGLGGMAPLSVSQSTPLTTCKRAVQCLCVRSLSLCACAWCCVCAVWP